MKRRFMVYCDIQAGQWKVLDKVTGNAVFATYNRNDARVEAIYRNKHRPEGNMSHKPADHPVTH